MDDPQKTLRANVRLLGRLLGNTMRTALGDDFLARIEKVRELSKSVRQGSATDEDALITLLHGLSDAEIEPVVRAFTQFLNLANIAEQRYSVSQEAERAGLLPDIFDELLGRLLDRGFSPAEIHQAVSTFSVELVITAHPTEVTRRTLVQKQEATFNVLTQLDHLNAENPDRTPRLDHQEAVNRLEQLISQTWHTEDFRATKPSPVEEAKAGFAMVERSIWYGVPEFLRRLEEGLQKHTGERLPLDANPVRFASWIGGDRDGNPNVTAHITREVLLLARWVAADLYLRDLRQLIDELSVTEATDALRKLTGTDQEPYRAVLKRLRGEIEAIRSACERALGQTKPDGVDAEAFRDDALLIAPLEACYRSLQECGLGVIADGPLLDTLRRAHCFGLALMKLDIRQEAARHTEVLDAVTRALDLGCYTEWDEADRQAFLLRELLNPRPLFPRTWQPSPEVREVLDTCELIARYGDKAFLSYVISMASAPSDVLAVGLLLRECGVRQALPIAPLFETLSALDQAGSCIERLWAIPWYREYCGERPSKKGEKAETASNAKGRGGHQMVMIGYSDSAKDAGWMAAGWAQYRAMERVTNVCRDRGATLTLFHGRGGTIGRGGGPAHAAILSQPPGSVDGRLRVTEQGEMIRFKFGAPEVAVRSLTLYASATLEATLLPPPVPKAEWRAIMDELSRDSLNVYRALVQEDVNFVPFFRAVTPEIELGRLPVGSRPSRRKPGGGLETLRAIPWIFAWSQIRLMLPTWLGCGDALNAAMKRHGRKDLVEMTEAWPFFRARLDMLEMIFMKTDVRLVRYYNERLVPENLRHFGEELCAKLERAIAAVLELGGRDALTVADVYSREGIALRNPYTDPLNILQVELLDRIRTAGDDCPAELERALMSTMAGIAAGMRNTG